MYRRNPSTSSVLSQGLSMFVKQSLEFKRVSFFILLKCKANNFPCGPEQEHVSSWCRGRRGVFGMGPVCCQMKTKFCQENSSNCGVESYPFYWNFDSYETVQKLKWLLFWDFFVNTVIVQRKRCFFPTTIIYPLFSKNYRINFENFGDLDFDESDLDLSFLFQWCWRKYSFLMRSQMEWIWFSFHSDFWWKRLGINICLLQTHFLDRPSKNLPFFFKYSFVMSR